MKQPTVKDLLETIARLEARVKQLEARPALRVEHHHYQHPAITWQPIVPTTQPWTPPWMTTCRTLQLNQ